MNYIDPVLRVQRDLAASPTGTGVGTDATALRQQGALNRENRAAAYGAARETLTNALPSTKSKLGYNPTTREFMVAGTILPKRLEVLQELATTDPARLPDMDLPAGFVDFDPAALRNRLSELKPEGNFFGRAGAGAKSTLGLAASAVDSLVGNDDPSNSWSRELQNQWQDETYSEQRAAQLPWYDNLASFSSGAGEGLGNVAAIGGTAALAAGATALSGGTATPAALAAVAGVVGGAAAFGEQATESYDTSIDTLLSLSESERMARSPLYRQKREQGLSVTEAAQQTAIEGARAAGLPAAALGALESAIGARWVGGRLTRLLPGSEVTAAGRTLSPLERLAQKNFAGRVGAAGARSVLGGTGAGAEEVAETALGQASGASITGLGSVDPRDYASWEEFSKAFQTGALLGPLGGGRGGRAADPGALNLVKDNADPITTSPEAAALGAAPAGGFTAQTRQAAEQWLMARFGDAPIEDVMADPEGRQALAALMGAGRADAARARLSEAGQGPSSPFASFDGTPSPGQQTFPIEGMSTNAAGMRFERPAPARTPAAPLLDTYGNPEPDEANTLALRRNQLFLYARDLWERGKLREDISEEMMTLDNELIDDAFAELEQLEAAQPDLFTQPDPDALARQPNTQRDLFGGAPRSMLSDFEAPVEEAPVEEGPSPQVPLFQEDGGPAPPGPLIRQRAGERAAAPAAGAPALLPGPNATADAGAQLQQELDDIDRLGQQRAGTNWRTNKGFARTNIGKALLAAYNEAASRQQTVLADLQRAADRNAGPLTQLPNKPQRWRRVPDLRGLNPPPAAPEPAQAPTTPAPSGNRPLGVAPAPLPNPEPMAPAERASRNATQQERGQAPAAPAAAAPVPQTTPEPAADIAAQLIAMLSPGSTKDAVWVPKGSPLPPGKMPKVITVVTTPQGTLLTVNPAKAQLARQGKLTDAKLAKILDYTETKAEAVASGAPVVVQAKDTKGNDVASTVSSPGRTQKAAAEMRRQAPEATVTVTTPEAAQADRVTRRGRPRKDPDEETGPVELDSDVELELIKELAGAYSGGNRDRIRAVRSQLEGATNALRTEKARKNAITRVEAAAQAAAQPASGRGSKGRKFAKGKKPATDAEDTGVVGPTGLTYVAADALPTPVEDDAALKKAEDDLRARIEVEHPKWLKAYEAKDESIVVAMPLTDLEMAAVENGFQSLFVAEQARIEARDAPGGNPNSWTFRDSPARRALNSILSGAGVVDERQLRAIVSQLANASTADIMRLLSAPDVRENVRDSLHMKALVRGGVVYSGIPTPAQDIKGAELLTDDLGDAPVTDPVKAEALPAPNVGEGVRQYHPSEELAAVLREWLNLVGLTDSFTVDLVTPGQLATLMPRLAERVGKNLGGAYARGLNRDGVGALSIAVRADLPLAEQLEILAHELGHHIEYVMLSEADPAAVAELHAAHQLWLAGQGVDLDKAIGSSWPGMLGASELAKIAGGHAKARAYHHSFTEWLANNISRYLVTRDVPEATTPGQKLLKKIADAFKALYSALVDMNVYPDETVARFMEQHVIGPASKKYLKRARVPTVSKMLRMEGSEEPSLPVEPLLTQAGRNAAKRAAVTKPLQDAVRSALGGNLKDAGSSVASAAQSLSRGKARDLFDSAVFAVSTLRDMKARAAKWGEFGKALGRWVDLQFEIQKLSNEARREGEEALELSNRLPAAEREKLQVFMQRATTSGIHADRPFDHPTNAHLKAADPDILMAAQAEHARLSRDWAALSPDTQAAYKALLAAPRNLYAEMISAKKANVTGSKLLSDEAKADALAALERLEKETLQGPYFPLMRTGDYIVTARLPAVPLLDTDGSRFADKAKAKARAEQAKIENPHARVEVSGDEESGYILNVFERAVYFFPTLRDAELAAPAIEREVRDGLTKVGVSFDTLQDVLGEERVVSTPFLKQDFFNNSKQVPSKFLDNMRELLAEGKIDAVAFRAAETMYIEAAPEFSHRKTGLTRQNIRGASENMLESYAVRLVGAGHNLATLQRATQVDAAWRDMTKEGKADPLYTRAQNRLFKGQQLVSERTANTPFNRVSNVVTDLSSMYSLAFSPAYVVMNAMQPLMVSLPVMAGMVRASDNKVVGITRAMKALQTAYGGAPSFFGAKGIAEFKAEFAKMAGSASQTRGSMEKAILEQFAKTPAQRAMLADLLSRGTLDFDFLNSLHDAMGGTFDNRVWRPLQRMGMALPQQVESMNRVVTALATFDLAVNELGMDAKSPTTYQFVDTIVAQTQMDYSRVNRPTLFNRPLVSIFLQFKMYLQGMYSLMVQQGARALSQRRPGETQKEYEARRKQGMVTMAYFLSTHAAIGGAVGLGPVYEIASAAVALAASPFTEDDDWLTDEEFVAKLLRDAARDVLGDEAGDVTAEVLTRGLPNLMGVDVADRMGLPLLYDSRFAGSRESDTLGTSAEKVLLFSLGAPYSNAKRVLNGVGAAMDGDMVEASKALPAALRSFVGAARGATQGIVDKDGDVILAADKINPLNAAVMATGFQTSAVSRTYRQRSTEQGAIARTRAERDGLLKEFRTSDPSDRASVRESVREFNARVPAAFRLRPDQLRQSVESKRERESGRPDEQLRAVRKLTE